MIPDVTIQFCPCCAGNLAWRHVPADDKQRLVCAACGYVYYFDPKVSACTIPFLDGKVVMLRRANEPSRGKWVFPGGFMERGETVEQAAIRETFEEVGLQVDVTHLLNVYSYPESVVIVVVYLAQVVGGVLRLSPEASELGLFAPDEIPWEELAFPSTRRALEDWIARSSG